MGRCLDAKAVLYCQVVTTEGKASRKSGHELECCFSLSCLSSEDLTSDTRSNSDVFSPLGGTAGQRELLPQSLHLGVGRCRM